MSGWPTTRRYPRTTQEAWQQDGYAAVYYYKTVPRFDRVMGVLLAVVIGVFAAMALVHWWAA